MAILFKGILDGVSGKIGDLVGRKTKHQNIITSSHRSPKSNKTMSQLQVEQTMGQLRGLGSLLYVDLLRSLIFVGSLKTTILGQFVKWNFTQFNQMFEPLYLDVIFCQGSLLNSPINTISLKPTLNEIRITWKKNWTVGSLAENDNAYLVLINQTTGEVTYEANQTKRIAKTIIVKQFSLVNTDLIHAYLMFNRENNRLTSNTNYKVST